MGALARTTTNPDTFIFMAGDLIHHGGQLRPSPYLQIPTRLSNPSNDIQMTDLGSLFEKLLLSRTGSMEKPFFLSTDMQVVDEVGLMSTRRKAQQVDARDDIWLICAHDPTISEVVEFFPASANGWKAKGWRDKTFWSFLGDFRGAVDISVKDFHNWMLRLSLKQEADPESLLRFVTC